VSALTRRDFLATASAATMSALAAGLPRRLDAAETLVPTADAVIVLWMAGGMAHTETFDPKRYTPYAAGLPDRRAQHFPAIDTAVDHIKIRAGPKRIAGVMDHERRFAPTRPATWLHPPHRATSTSGTQANAPPQTVPRCISAPSSRARWA
jgi:hypothetical protein